MDPSGADTSNIVFYLGTLAVMLKVGNVGVLEAFRTFIYDGQVNGVSDGLKGSVFSDTDTGFVSGKADQESL